MAAETSGVGVKAAVDRKVAVGGGLRETLVVVAMTGLTSLLPLSPQVE